MLNKLSKEDQDKLFIGGAGFLGFSTGWIPGFRRGVDKYLDYPFYVTEINTRRMINSGRKAGLKWAIPFAVFFSGLAKACTMLEGDPRLKSEKTPSTSTVSPRP